MMELNKSRKLPLNSSKILALSTKVNTKKISVNLSSLASNQNGPSMVRSKIQI